MGAVKTKRMPRAVREQQMLDAAVETFGRRGYTAASMDEIAELAGVSKPLVYLYLNSKEDLFTACVRREARAVSEAVRAAVDPARPADRRLWDGLLAFFTHTGRHPHAWAVLHVQARTHGEVFAAEVAAYRAELVTFVAGLILVAARETPRETSEETIRETAEMTVRETAEVTVRETVREPADETPREPGPGRPRPAPDVTGLAEALVGAAESLAAWANTTDGVTPRRAAATLMNFAWAGLGGLLAGQPWSPPAPDA